MTGPLLLAAVALAGGIGSTLRYVVDGAVGRRTGNRYPWGITAVNLTGSFALGLLTGAAPGGPWATVAGTGLLGGYTTFSTASVDTVRLLLDEHRPVAAAVNGVGLLGACVLLAVAGMALTT